MVHPQALLHNVDKKTGKKSKTPPMFVKQGGVIIARIETTQPICLETYADYPQLGRFTLRDEGEFGEGRARDYFVNIRLQAKPLLSAKSRSSSSTNKL